MKLSKTEKIWLGVVVVLYLLYNFPLVPGYNQPKATLIHAALTLIPLWISVYVGLSKVCKERTLRKNEEEEDKSC